MLELDKYFAHRKEMERRENYWLSSQPYIREMCQLRALFTRYKMTYSPTGILISDEQAWTDPKAEALYHKYEEGLKALKETIFNDSPCQPPKSPP